MKDGRNEFVVPIGKQDIAEIYDSSRQLRIEDLNFIKSAPYEDVMTAYVLLSLESFLAKRNIPLPFKVVLSE